MTRPMLQTFSFLVVFALPFHAAAPLCSADPQESPAAETPETTDGEEILAPDEEEVEEVDWAAMAEPGEHHAHLDAFAGNWSFIMRIWNSPSGEPLEIEGEAEATWQLDGRFLDTIYRAEMGGKTFVGRAIEGYDNFAQEYIRLWQDNRCYYG